MELFPNGGFARLRSRARDKYVHADEDATGVSLRPLGAAPSVNAVWKVEHRPVQGWDAFFLLQGAAYGRYLAASQSHRPDAPLQLAAPAWRLPSCGCPDRVAHGQNYVRLHNTDMRCLRANGRHHYWNNAVTVDVRNGSRTTMMQWRVEAIPLSPVPLPLPPPPQPLVGTCNTYDYSVSNLRTEVAARQDDQNITLCVRAGVYALVIPLMQTCLIT